MSLIKNRKLLIFNRIRVGTAKAQDVWLKEIKMKGLTYDTDEI